MIEKIDVLIVGSGPAGSSVALHLLQHDPTWAQRFVVIDKAIHPREKLCGGGITHLGENVLSDLGLQFEPTNFPVREVRIQYEDKSYSFLGDPVLRIVHRAEFDHWFMQQVEKRGGCVRQGEAVIDVIDRQDYIEVITDSCTYHAQVLVAADGSRSFVRQKLKWDSPTGVARLIEVLTPETEQTSWEFRDGVAVFDFTRMTSHNLQGYYWDFPSIVDGQTQMNRGVFDSRTYRARPKADLKSTLRDSMIERDRVLKDKSIKGHPIRWFNLRGAFSRPRILLAGDSAGVDPLFGEGIGPALAYGVVAADVIVDAFKRQNFAFTSYKRRIWMNPILFTVPMRTVMAQFAYVLRYPRLFRVGWWIAKYVIKLTPWRSPKYVAARPPRLQ